ncbi:hypothetical protein F5X98DRAFT_379548 [Xylaria grammica]|nr:hypothetical protein F5X98DRAFT_379548 [Xylaria grammica]
MSTTSYSTSGSRPTSRHYDTGFPDSFASCTTSMRHPDAIIDPGFAISAEHIDPAKTLHRSRKSLLHKHRRTISHGKINEETLDRNLTTIPPMGLPAHDSTTELVHQKSRDVSAGIAQPSGAGAESPSGAKGPEPILSISPGFQYTDADEHDSEERRHNSIFRKLMNKN